MRQKLGEDQIPSGETMQRSPQIATSVDGGAAVLPWSDVDVAVGSRTLARLARFGLAMTGEPLLEPKRERT